MTKYALLLIGWEANGTRVVAGPFIWQWPDIAKRLGVLVARKRGRTELLRSGHGGVRVSSACIVGLEENHHL